MSDPMSKLAETMSIFSTHDTVCVLANSVGVMYVRDED